MPGLRYAVQRVYNENDERKNGVIQVVTVELPGGNGVTGAYIFPNSSPAEFTNFVHNVMTETDGTCRDWLIGDLSVRDKLWDTMGNTNGKVL